jgi:hypothetical protein
MTFQTVKAQIYLTEAISINGNPRKLRSMGQRRSHLGSNGLKSTTSKTQTGAGTLKCQLIQMHLLLNQVRCHLFCRGLGEIK